MKHSDLHNLRRPFSQFPPRSTWDRPRVTADESSVEALLTQPQDLIIQRIRALLDQHRGQRFSEAYVSRLFSCLPFISRPQESSHSVANAQQDLALVQSLLIALEERALPSSLQTQVQDLRQRFDQVDGFMEWDATFRQGTFFFARTGAERVAFFINLASALSGMAASALGLWAGARQQYGLGLISGVVNAVSQSTLHLAYRVLVEHQSIDGEAAVDAVQAAYDALVCSLISYGMGNLGARLGINEKSDKALRGTWFVAESLTDVCGEYFSGLFGAARRITGYETTNLSHLTLRRMGWGLFANGTGEFFGTLGTKPLHRFSPKMHEWALQKSSSNPLNHLAKGLQLSLLQNMESIHAHLPFAPHLAEWMIHAGTATSLSNLGFLAITAATIDTKDDNSTERVEREFSEKYKYGAFRGESWSAPIKAFLSDYSNFKTARERVVAIRLFGNFMSNYHGACRSYLASDFAEAMAAQVEDGSEELAELASAIRSCLVLYSDNPRMGTVCRRYAIILSKFKGNITLILDQLAAIHSLAEEESDVHLYIHNDEIRAQVKESASEARREKERFREILCGQLNFDSLFAYWRNPQNDSRSREAALRCCRQLFPHFLRRLNWETCKEYIRAILSDSEFENDFAWDIKNFIESIRDSEKAAELEEILRELAFKDFFTGRLAHIFFDEENNAEPYRHLINQIDWTIHDPTAQVVFLSEFLKIAKEKRRYAAHVHAILATLRKAVFSKKFKDSPFKEARLKLLDTLIDPEEILSFLEENFDEDINAILSEEEYLYLLPKLEKIYLEHPDLHYQLSCCLLSSPKNPKIFFQWIENLLETNPKTAAKFLDLFKVRFNQFSYQALAQYAQEHPHSAFQIFYHYYQAGLPFDRPDIFEAYLASEDPEDFLSSLREKIIPYVYGKVQIDVEDADSFLHAYLAASPLMSWDLWRNDYNRKFPTAPFFVKAGQSFHFNVEEQNIGIIFCENNLLDRIVRIHRESQIARIVVEGVWCGNFYLSEVSYDSRKAWKIQFNLFPQCPFSSDAVFAGIVAGLANIARQEPEVDYVLFSKATEQELVWSRDADPEKIDLAERFVSQGDEVHLPQDKNTAIQLFSKLFLYLIDPSKPAAKRKIASRILMKLFKTLGYSHEDFAEIIAIKQSEEGIDAVGQGILAFLYFQYSNDVVEQAPISKPEDAPRSNSLLTALATVLGLRGLAAVLKGRVVQTVQEAVEANPIGLLPDSVRKDVLDLGLEKDKQKIPLK